MASFTRANAWNQGGTFSNQDLLWYAKGVGVMQSRTLDKPNSWWFFAAIHAQYITNRNTQFPGWSFLPAPPQVPTTPLPSQALRDLYWDQCQHQSWYFAPWHRGYLLALEAQIRAAVVNLGGPPEWALPYWNYFGPNDEFKIPPAFTQQTLPDGNPNPLFVKARYGPNFNGDIFVTTDENADCQTDTVYTGSYGGPQTPFWQGGTFPSGDLEENPHNGVHGDVGGYLNRRNYGLMSDPGTAGLDPIFYFHHCNIDRMWAAWNANGNSNPTDQNWLGGPAASGDRKFAMPMPDGSSWVYTPDDVKSLSQLDYDYDDLTVAVSPQPPTQLAQRLIKLGAAPAAVNKAPGGSMDSEEDVELVGAHDGALRVTSAGARATVRLDSDVKEKVSTSLAAASDESPPDRVYLRLENVRGNIDATKLYVSVNQQQVGRVALFGLGRASSHDGEHGGGGLTFVLDITDVIDNLFLGNALDARSLDVRIEPNHEVPDDEELTVGRVSVYRQGQQ
ncbi:MAG TPA: tyrosinase family protein [Pyrinomonadaceae bacterium]|nr:tyrosinase family protein [Pyrinomonadaceae bacterium]